MSSIHRWIVFSIILLRMIVMMMTSIVRTFVIGRSNLTRMMIRMIPMIILVNFYSTAAQPTHTGRCVPTTGGMVVTISMKYSFTITANKTTMWI